jgi:hypothetical protein
MKIRIEEVSVGSAKNYEFTKDVWIESNHLLYGDLVEYENETWIVVEVEEQD